MIQLSFPTRKLGEDIIRINKRVKDYNASVNKTVLGVTNSKGITVTGIKASEDLSNYIVIKGKQFEYNPYRVNVGSIGLTDDSQEGVVSPAYIVFKTKETLIPEFLLFYLKSSIGINLIRWYGNRGGVRDALRYGDLCKIDIPDLTIEQQKIALDKIQIFEKQLTLLNIEIEKQKNLLKAFKTSILNELSQGKLVEQNENDEPSSILLKKITNEKEILIKEKKIKKEKILPPISNEEIPYKLPKGWEWSRLGNIVKIISGYAFKSGDFIDKNGVKSVKITNIGVGEFIEDNSTLLPETFTQEYVDYLLVEKDILIALTRPYIKEGLKVCICPPTYNQTLLNQRVASIRNFSECELNEYLFLYLKSPTVLNYVKVSSRTMNQPNLSVNSLKDLLVPIPPLNEQKRIVKKVNQLLELCDELENNIKESKQESERLMGAVLQEAFTLKEKSTF